MERAAAARLGAPYASRREALALGLAALAGGCAPSRDPHTLTMWAQSTEGENAPRILPPFTAATGLAVDLQALPWTAAHEKILTAYAGAALPDVMMVRNDWTSELAMLGALAPMPPGLAQDQFPGVLRTVTLGAVPVALPWMVDSLMQFYRRDLLAAAGYPAPPADWPTWKRMAHAVKRRQRDGYPVLMLLDWPEHLFGYAAQQPEPLLRDRDTRGNFSSAGFRAALAHYKSLFDEGLAPRIVGTEIGDMATSFAQGSIAILPGRAYFVGDLQNRAAIIPRERWAVAEMPGPAGAATGPIWGSSLAVAHTARNPARAWALVAYLCRPDTQRRFHAITGDLPSRPSAWAAPALAGDPVAAAFRRQIERGVADPIVPEWPRIQTEVQLVAEHMVRGEMGVDAAAAMMDARVDRLLAKRRWLLDRGLAA